MTFLQTLQLTRVSDFSRTFIAMYHTVTKSNHKLIRVCCHVHISMPVNLGQTNDEMTLGYLRRELVLQTQIMPCIFLLGLFVTSMMTSSNGNISRVIGPLCGEFAEEMGEIERK